MRLGDCVADDILVLRRASGVAPGPGNQGAMGAEFRLAALDRLAVELRLAEIVADNAAGSETHGADAIGRVVPAQFDHF